MKRKTKSRRKPTREAQKTLKEIQDWESKILKPNTTQKVLDYAGKPIEWLSIKCQRGHQTPLQAQLRDCLVY